MTAETTETPGAGSPPDLWGLGDDDAITGPEQDAFGRAPFARHLADVIETAPEAASFRIGLFGEWGEGKTSVMALVRHYLGDAYVSVRISAWDAADANDVVRRVATALAEEAGVGRTLRAQARAAVNHAAGKLGLLRKLAANGPALAKGVDAVVGETVEHAVEAKLTEYRQYDAARLIREANAALGERRAVIFVDDLDRADPVALPRVLMALREAVPVAGLVFVLALSATAVADALGKSGYGLEAPARFLEKIVEFPAYLPAISRERLRAYAAKRIGEIPGLRAPDALDALASVLPSNPRRLKRYLRALAAMRRTFDRFDDGEIDWLGAYLAQLLLVEFPDEARALRADTAAVASLRGSGALLTGLRPDRNRVTPPPEAAYAPADGAARAGFLAICERIRGQESVYGEYPPDVLLSLDVAPPALTRREAAQIVDDLAALGEGERPSGIRAAVRRDGSPDVERVDALWARVLSGREGAMTSEVRETDPVRREAAAAAVEALTAVAESCARDARLFEDGLLGQTAWSAWLTQVRVFSAVHDAPRWTSLRAREVALLDEMTERASLGTLEAIAPTLDHELEFWGVPGHEYPEWYRDAVRRVAARVDDAVAEGVLRRFDAPGGIDALAHADWNEHGKRLLVVPTSPLYGDAGRARLAALAARAEAGERTVQANCLSALRLLDAATHGEAGGAYAPEAARVLSNRGVLGPLWRGASTGPLTEMAAHLLSRVRIRALARLGPSAAAVLPVPGWWTPEFRENASASERAVAITAASAPGGDGQPAGPDAEQAVRPEPPDAPGPRTPANLPPA